MHTCGMDLPQRIQSPVLVQGVGYVHIAESNPNTFFQRGGISLFLHTVEEQKLDGESPGGKAGLSFLND